MSILCEPRQPNVSEIVANWKRLTDRPPWNRLTEHEWVDHLPPLLDAMLDAAVCGPGSEENRRRVVELAVEHGNQRRRLGLPLETLLAEHDYLRSALWQFVSAHPDLATSNDGLTEVVRFDTAATVAAIASLCGYHRSEIASHHDWEGKVSKLIAEWEELSPSVSPVERTLRPAGDLVGANVRSDSGVWRPDAAGSTNGEVF